MAELSTGADRYGFNPFCGNARFPGHDSFPGPLSSIWKPYFTDVTIAYNYAGHQAVLQGNKAGLQALNAAGIGDKV